MIYKAEPEFTKALLLLPESGMGYQIVDARRFGRTWTERFVVYNAKLVIEYNDSFSTYKNVIKLGTYSKIVDQSAEISLYDPTLTKRSFFSNIRNISDYSMHLKGKQTSGTGAINNPPISCNGMDFFVRLSAYADDMRIDVVNRRIIPGTYTTTEKDYLDCKENNDDPIDRYALPNDEPIQWAFWIQPKKTIDIYKPGIVQPANGHNGGGIEALFENGTANNTVLARKPY